MWGWENKGERSRAAAGSLVRLKAGLGSELCWIMDVFPFLALPPRALMGACSTAWCLHPDLSKNVRKSSGELVRKELMASATISHTHCGIAGILFWSTTCRMQFNSFC